MDGERVLKYFRFEFEILGLGYALCAILGIVGNVLTLKTFWRERKASWFHLQLSVANIFCLLATALSSPSSFRGHWLFGKSMCQWYGFQTCLAAYAEMMFTCAICVETYFAICKTNKYESISKKVYMVVSGCIWAYSLVFSVAPLLGWNRYLQERHSVSCGLDMSTRMSRNLSYMTVTHGIFVLVVIATVVVLAATVYSRKKGNESNTFSPLFNDTELLKSSAGLFVVLIICCLPYYLRVISFIRGTRPIFRSFLASEFSKLAVKLGGCLQPYVYLVFSGHFKSHCIATFTGVIPEKKRN